MYISSMSTIAFFDDPSILNSLHWKPLVSILYAKSSSFTIYLLTSTKVWFLFKMANKTAADNYLVESYVDNFWTYSRVFVFLDVWSDNKSCLNFLDFVQWRPIKYIISNLLAWFVASSLSYIAVLPTISMSSSSLSSELNIVRIILKHLSMVYFWLILVVNIFTSTKNVRWFR